MKSVFTFIAAMAGLSLAIPASAEQQRYNQQAQQQMGEPQQQVAQDQEQDQAMETPFDFDWLYIHTPAGPDLLISDQALWEMHRGITISGEVVATRGLEIDGQAHRLVRVRTDSGTMATIDLGTRDLPFQVREGQRFSATGDLGRIRDVPVLMADRAQFQGQTYQIGHRAHVDGQRIERPEQPQRQMRQPGQPQMRQPGQPQMRQPGQPQMRQPGQPQMRQPGQQAMGQQELQQLAGRAVTLRGEVLSTRTARIEGQQQTIASVRTERGNLLNVALGTGELGFNVEQGKTISAIGRLGEWNNQPTVFARMARADDQTFMLQQPVTPQRDQPMFMGQPAERPGAERAERRKEQAEKRKEEAQKRKEDAKRKGEDKRKDGEKRKARKADIEAGQELNISGTLSDARLVRLQDEDDRHVLVKVDTEEQGTIIANLGSRNEVRDLLTENDLRLRRGQEISISGISGRINGLPVLIAQRLNVEETEIDLPLQERQQDE